jgi:hypothetical protein
MSDRYNAGLLTDISREACDRTINDLWDRAKATEARQAANLILALRAALDRAEADAVARVEAMREAAARLVETTRHIFTSNGGAMLHDIPAPHDAIATTIRAITPPASMGCPVHGHDCLGLGTDCRVLAPMTVRQAAKVLLDYLGQKHNDHMISKGRDPAKYESEFSLLLKQMDKSAALSAITEAKP